jgi:hypothetical protein
MSEETEKFTIKPGRYFYPDGQFYGLAYRILDDQGEVVASYASKVQAEEKLASLLTGWS